MVFTRDDYEVVVIEFVTVGVWVLSFGFLVLGFGCLDVGGFYLGDFGVCAAVGWDWCFWFIVDLTF